VAGVPFADDSGMTGLFASHTQGQALMRPVVPRICVGRDTQMRGSLRGAKAGLCPVILQCEREPRLAGHPRRRRAALARSTNRWRCIKPPSTSSNSRKSTAMDKCVRRQRVAQYRSLTDWNPDPGRCGAGLRLRVADMRDDLAVRTSPGRRSADADCGTGRLA
jgi:hypothetical protein